VTTWQHIRNGWKWGFPVCCILRWVIGHRLGECTQAADRGVCQTATVRPGGTDANFVPCGVFHRAHFSVEQRRAELGC
jgi:hypothetical protein